MNMDATAPLAPPAIRHRLVESQGAWWFADGGGATFLSRGVTCIGPGPDAPKPGRPEYTPATRGNEPYETWQARTLGRLRAWGFDTAAGWCHRRFEKSGLHATPVLHLGVQGQAPWSDPWDPAFATRMRELAGALVEPSRGDPNVLGYFLDNEFGWGDVYLLGIACGWGADAPGKRRLVETLRNTYKDDFKAFAADFETAGAKDWDGFRAATEGGPKPGRGHRALDAWTYEVARAYYEICAGAVRAADPGALVLGDRFRQFYPPAVARAARGVLDAISTNYESTTTDGWVSPAYFVSMHELSGLPVIIGEFYATARQNRSGNRNTGGHFTLLDTQAERARAAAAQARAYARFPFVVGWHWFQWCDEPTHGRDDGEDYNMGLVDIHDVPYEELTAALTATNASAAADHAAGVAWLAGIRGDGFKGPLRVARQRGILTDGRLGEWNKEAPVPRSLIRTEAPQRPFGDVLVAWDEDALHVAIRAYDFSIPAGGNPAAHDPATWGDLHRLRLKAGGFELKAATGLLAGEKAPEAAWKPVVWALPPPAGRLSAAVATHIDRWHYVWEVAVPAVEVGGDPLKAGRTLSLSLDVENRGDFERMRIEDLAITLTDAP